jgi:hypothetical protein
MRLLKIEALWNHDPFLAWADDRWRARQQGTWGSDFARNMFAAYRDLPADARPGQEARAKETQAKTGMTLCR